MNSIKHKMWQSGVVVMATLALAGCSPQSTVEPTVAAAQIELRLIETTDLHAYMLGYDYFRQQPTEAYGLAHTAALIADARAANPNHYLVDNGDLIQGSAFGDWVADQGAEYVRENQHPIMRVLNYLDYDVGNMGNHEFNYGLEFIYATAESANFPYISANVFHAESPNEWGKVTSGWENPLFPPYVILDKPLVDQFGQEHVVKVGFIGFIPPQIVRWDLQHLEGKVRVRDMVAAAEHFVPQMRAAGADVVVAIPHSGLRVYDNYPQFAEQASYQLAGVAGIDAIMFGHQHQLFPGSPAYDNLPDVDNENGYVRGVPAVSPGYWGNHLGIIDLTLEQQNGSWGVVASAVSVPAIDSRKDEQIEQMLAAEQAATLTMLNQPLGEVDTAISTAFARIQPSTAVQLINDAQTWYVRQLQDSGELPADLPLLSAAAPFRNGFQSADDYTMIAAGEFTLGNLVDLYVYPNTLQVVELTGAELVEWLEMTALAYQQIAPGVAEQPLFTRYPSFNFDILTGLTYAFDISQPPRYSTGGELINPQARRVINVQYQGQALQPEQRFLVAVNNYRAGGGGNFPSLDGRSIVYSSGEEVRQVIAAYARAQTAENDGMLAIALEKNWQLVLPTGAKVTFRGNDGAKARREASEISGLARRGEADGYALYELTAAH